MDINALLDVILAKLAIILIEAGTIALVAIFIILFLISLIKFVFYSKSNEELNDKSRRYETNRTVDRTRTRS